MTENQSAGGTDDPVQTLLLGFANQIDQLAGLIAGTGGPGFGGSPVPDLLGEIGALVKELGDLLARIIAAFVAVLEAIADTLRSEQNDRSAVATRFQNISVNVTPNQR